MGKFKLSLFFLSFLVVVPVFADSIFVGFEYPNPSLFTPEPRGIGISSKCPSDQVALWYGGSDKGFNTFAVYTSVNLDLKKFSLTWTPVIPGWGQCFPATRAGVLSAMMPPKTLGDGTTAEYVTGNNSPFPAATFMVQAQTSSLPKLIKYQGQDYLFRNCEADPVNNPGILTCVYDEVLNHGN